YGDGLVEKERPVEERGHREQVDDEAGPGRSVLVDHPEVEELAGDGASEGEGEDARDHAPARCVAGGLRDTERLRPYGAPRDRGCRQDVVPDVVEEPLRVERADGVRERS